MTCLCQVMGVSKSGFYEWLNKGVSPREEENAVIRNLLLKKHSESRGLYGRRRLTQALAIDPDSPSPSINRVRRQMKAIDIAGYRPKSFKKTTIPDATKKDAPNHFLGCMPKSTNEVWVSDITYIRTKEGWCYLCTVIDLYNREVIGWSLDSHMRAELVTSAMRVAFESRKPPRHLIFHSDKGGQYKSKAVHKLLKRKGAIQSMTGEDHCFDNPHAESFFGTLKKELIRGTVFENRQAAESAIFEYIEVFYNRKRLHSSLGYQTPCEFEGAA